MTSASAAMLSNVEAKDKQHGSRSGSKDGVSPPEASGADKGISLLGRQPASTENSANTPNNPPNMANAEMRLKDKLSPSYPLSPTSPLSPPAGPGSPDAFDEPPVADNYSKLPVYTVPTTSVYHSIKVPAGPKESAAPVHLSGQLNSTPTTTPPPNTPLHPYSPRGSFSSTEIRRELRSTSMNPVVDGPSERERLLANHAAADSSTPKERPLFGTTAATKDSTCFVLKVLPFEHSFSFFFSFFSSANFFFLLCF